MQALDPAGLYTDDEVIDALTARRGSREMSFRYDRLDEHNTYLEPITWVRGGSVANNSLADIKRTAKFSIVDRTPVNFLRDRVQPWCRLVMPRRDYWEPGAVVRTNHVTNPTGATTTYYFTGSGSGGSTLALEARTSGGPLGICRTFVRQKWATSPTSSNISLNNGSNTGPQNAVQENVEYTFSVYTRSNIPGVMLGARIQWRDAANSIIGSALVSPPAAIALDTWERRDVTGTAPSGAVRADVSVYQPTNVAYPLPNNTTHYLDMSALLLEEGGVVGDFFAGNTTNPALGPGFFHEWLGATNGSKSVERILELIEDDRPGFVEWPLGVFLLSTPDRQLDDVGIVAREVEAYDQLVVLRDDKVEARYSIDEGELYTNAIAALIDTVPGMAAAITPSALELPAVMEWEPGTPKLRILNDLLDRINYGSAWFDEYGTLICRPYQSPAELPVEYAYEDGQASVRTGSATQTLDLFDVPNKWLLIKSEPDQDPLTAVYTNDSPTSPTSTVNRGRTILDVRTEDDAADQATLDAKAARYAFEASQVYEAIDFTTLVMPMHSNADVLALNLPGLAVDAKYGEQSWAFDLAVGATMTHKVRRVVSV